MSTVFRPRQEEACLGPGCWEARPDCVGWSCPSLGVCTFPSRPCSGDWDPEFPALVTPSLLLEPLWASGGGHPPRADHASSVSTPCPIRLCYRVCVCRVVPRLPQLFFPAYRVCSDVPHHSHYWSSVWSLSSLIFCGVIGDLSVLLIL